MGARYIQVQPTKLLKAMPEEATDVIFFHCKKCGKSNDAAICETGKSLSQCGFCGHTNLIMHIDKLMDMQDECDCGDCDKEQEDGDYGFGD